MANFSKVIKDHNEMRKTITQLEAVKKRIKASVREQNPPDEFALRNNMSAIGQSGFEGNEIVDDVVKDTGEMSVEILLKTLFRGIESTLLNPRNANNLWTRMKNSVPNGTATLRTALQNLTRILDRLSSNASFSSTDTQQIKVSIEQLLKELFPDVNQRPNVYNYNQYTDIRISNRTANVNGQPPAGGNNNAGPAPDGGNNNAGLAPPDVPDNNIPAEPVQPEVREVVDDLLDQLSGNESSGFETATDSEAGEPTDRQQSPPISGDDIEAGAPEPGKQDDIAAAPLDEPVVEPVVAPANIAITKKEAEDTLYGLLQMKTSKGPLTTRKIGKIQTLLDRNMNLKKGLLMKQDYIPKYQKWAKILYFGGVLYADNYLEKVTSKQVKMDELVEEVEHLQDEELQTKKKLMQNPNLRFMAKFMFDSNPKYIAMRQNAFQPKPATPTRSPSKSPAKQFVDAAKNLFSPSKKRPPTPGTQSGADTQATTPVAAGAKRGRGLKHTGLKTVKQIISRTENLIQAANLGNKSTEVRNELDTLLAVLIDRKEVRPQFRTNLMKRLF